MTAWISDQRNEEEEASGFADGVVEPDFGFNSVGVEGAAGVPSCDFVGSEGIGKPADFWSLGGAPADCAFVGASAAGGAGASALPRMIGKPSFPPPTITTFAFVEPAS